MCLIGKTQLLCMQCSGIGPHLVARGKSHGFSRVAAGTWGIFSFNDGDAHSWQIDGETVETVADFSFWGSKITADGDCSNEIKRRLLLGRKVMINLDSILKSRDITWPTKVHLVKAMVFPVVMYGCELDCKES